jgi:hypothetical protein
MYKLCLDVPDTTLWFVQDVAKDYELGLGIVVGPLLRCTLDAVLERAEISSDERTTEEVLSSLPLATTSYHSQLQLVTIPIYNHDYNQEPRIKGSPSHKKHRYTQLRKTRHKQQHQLRPVNQQEDYPSYQDRGQGEE